MKPIRLVLSPTRSRPLNLFLGMVLILVALLFLLALATYHASDPSLDTATGTVLAHNWIGLFGAYLSDLLLQTLGLTSFLLPLWLGHIGWTWMRSRPGGTPILRAVGTVLTLAFLPAIFGLLPWHWRWLHVVPVEGVIGRLISALLVAYLNVQGAWLVSLALAAAGIYFASAIRLSDLRESIAVRWEAFQQWRERRRERRLEREDLRAEKEAQHAGPSELLEFPKFSEAAAQEEEEPPARRSNRLLSFFHRRPAHPEDPLDAIPAYQRKDQKPARVETADAPIPIAQRKPSIWERGVAADAPSAPAAAQPPIPVRASTPAPAPVPAVAPAPAAVSIPPAAPAPVREVSTPATAPRIDDDWTPSKSEPAAATAAAPLRPGEIAIHARSEAELRTATVAPKRVSGFKLPSTALLSPAEGPQSVREEELREEARMLVEKCAEFDVRGQVVQINPGPLVTTFEFKPEAGVKYSRVTGLADDLCLAMSAENIFIERIPGKSTVGIQMPNRVRETIHVREVLESESFQKAKPRLTMALGKDINGVRVVTTDLAVMPHILIAGSTGSGKSVAINAMIMSLLYRTTPQQVRLILVDPKRVELGMYEGIPHLFTPIITEPKLAANALRNAVYEMERRLKLLASRSVRNLEQYNKLFDGATPSLFDGEDDGPMPYIVIIIDELADLMMLDRANVEESITRLAQMSRAVGIHLVLATQRPSVDVITGLIKANIPTRISFRLATKVDSRTILDTNGAEALLGRGDMLFLPPGTSRLVRLHAPYVSEKETADVVAFWKAQGAAEYVEGFLESPKDDTGTVEGGTSDASDDDPMFDSAVRLVFEFGKASTSLLQRRLRIGYGRAAHLIDMMERDGLVGPADGSRPRELLKPPNWLHEVAVAND